MLKSLIIKNFRSLEDFQVEKLGRVNLIVGKNNSGKSSVLEALKIYASSGNVLTLQELADSHGEKYRLRDDERGEIGDLPFEHFFTGRQFPTNDDTEIEIGSVDSPDSRLHIQHIFLAEYEETVEDEFGEQRSRIRRKKITREEYEINSLEQITQAIAVTKGVKSYPPILLDAPRSMMRSRSMTELFDKIPCSAIPTQFISIDELADEWDKIALTEDEEIVKNALRIIVPEFENLIFVKNDDLPNPRYSQRNSFQRSAKIRLSDFSKPIPLNSLGDGMFRVLQLSIKLFSSKGGFLLIDEFENGLHYSVQEKVWALLFEMAQKLDVQIFATTHSWDCIESFAKVAIEKQDIDGLLFRVGQSVRNSDKGRVIATVFEKEQLFSITQSDVEVR